MLSLQREAASPALGSRVSRLALPAAVGLGLAGLTAYVAAVDPNSPGHYPVCPTFALTGLYCPGCGMLRATHDLLHGDVVGALARNPITPLFLAAIALLLGLWVHSRWTGTTLRWTPPARLPWVLAVGFVLFTVARNIPGWTWLSPA